MSSDDFIEIIELNTSPDSTGDDHEAIRITNFINACRVATGSVPKYIVRAPGRITLIGDHLDYHGFSVLPMAISNSILVGLSTKPSSPATKSLDQKEPNHSNQLDDSDLADQRKQLSIRNSQPETYPNYQCQHSFSHGSKLDQSHQWYHYVLCGYHGVLAEELLKIESSQVYKHSKDISDDCSRLDARHLKGLDEMAIFVDSNLPPASGLSSSSALVCASAIVTKLFLMDHQQQQRQQQQRSSKHGEVVKIDSRRLAEDCAKYEHLVGTHGGGMDQAVILTAQRNFAKHVQFMPEFKCHNVHLLDDVVWLISHCGISYPKAATSGFNSRVLETKLAAGLIVKTLDPTNSQIKLDHTITLGKVARELFESIPPKEFISIIKEKVYSQATDFTIDELCTKLEMSRHHLIANFRTSEEFLEKSQLDRRLCLFRRCQHVFEEADRVEQFRTICETTKDFKRLGQLMIESHASLRDNYDCSHPALDKLVSVSLEAGALGSRVSGAGWGGCIVSLVESSKCDAVTDALKVFSKFTFRTEPQSGATIFKVVAQ